jgi:hypothetical protein
MEPNYILEANMQDALGIAIRSLKEVEAKISPTFRSGFRAGLEENLAGMRAGRELKIR